AQLFLFFTFRNLTVDFPAAGILSKASCDLYRFVLIEEPKTWPEAQSYCREKYTDLVTVQSDADRARLKEAANAVNFSSVAWISFYKDPWLWSYQNTVEWESGQPDNMNGTEKCATADTDGLMADDTCSTRLPFYYDAAC
uniref:C-type lectin domain-containing protein n=1 Tax=Cyprinus carpio TaxID=7962 RepID=A0A8C2CZE7_CYPCA